MARGTFDYPVMCNADGTIVVRPSFSFASSKMPVGQIVLHIEGPGIPTVPERQPLTEEEFAQYLADLGAKGFTYWMKAI
jgi:hypothetical protein